MKYLGLILVVALVAGQVLAGRINENDSRLKHFREARGLSDKLRTFLENLKPTLREGNETLGIPKVDPYESDLLETDFDNEYIKGPAQLSNFEVSGLADYNVKKSDINILSRKLTIGLTWPHLYSRGSYKLNATALNKFEVWGEGEYRVTAKDLFFESVISLKVVGGVSIKKMDTKISLGSLSLSMTGLYDDEDASAILSETISDAVPQLIQDYHSEITALINEQVITIANEQLDGMSLSDLLGLIG